MDVNEKPASKFPRSSLRASNKTMIVSSSEAQKLRLESAREEVIPHHAVSSRGDEGGFSESGIQKAPLSSISQAEVALVEAFPDEGVASQPTREVDHKASGAVEDEDFGELFQGIDDSRESTSLEQQETQIFALEENGSESFELSAQESLSTERAVNGFHASHTRSAEASIPKMHEMERAAVPEQAPSLQHGKKECVEWRRPSKLIGFLVSFEAEPFGSYVELREGRLVISSEYNVSENCLVISDRSVSPMHAIMRIGSDGTILILDQLSEHGTRIKRDGDSKEEALMGDKSSLGHGDMVIFGECAYHVCILKRAER